MAAPSLQLGHPIVQGVISLAAATILLGLAWVFQPALKTRKRSSKSQTYSFLEAKGSASKGGNKSSAGVEKPFPSLDEAPSLLLSLVVPAFDEEQRLPIMLDEALEFMTAWGKRKSDLTYEIIVVDDGSRDKTAAVVQRYSEKYGSDTIRLLKLRQNLGKGGALREGMLHTRGSYALMVDADGATDITCLEKLYDRTKQVELETNAGVMAVGIGSRAHMEEASVAKRAWYRTILMRGLHVLVSILISRKIRDTQCGFKLFSRDSIRVLFGSLHLERWAFDLEIVYLADRLGLPMMEVQVNWHEVEGSKLIQSRFDVVKASVLMFRDMLCVRLCYLLGIWSPAVAQPIPTPRSTKNSRAKSE